MYPEYKMDQLMHSHEHPEWKQTKTIKMNCEIYYAIITYLEQQELPKYSDKWTMNMV